MEIPSYIQLMQMTQLFYKNLGLKKIAKYIFLIFIVFRFKTELINLCDVAQIGLLKGVKVAVCGIKCINLTKDTTKIQATFFV